MRGMTYSDIKQAILTMNEEKIKEDNIGTLIQIVPTDEEQKQVCDHQLASDEVFAEPENFIKTVSGIKNQVKRLEAWQTKMKFTTDIGSIKPILQNMDNAIREMKESKEFHKFLGIVLAFGNYLNGKNKKKVIFGFKIKSLSKLNDTKSADGKVTLLQYIATFVAKEYPEMVDLGSHLKSCGGATKFNGNSIKDDIKNIKEGLKNITEQIKIADATALEGDLFSEIMKRFLDESGTLVSIVEEGLEKIFVDLKDLAKLYTVPENDMLQKPEEFFWRYIRIC